MVIFQDMSLRSRHWTFSCLRVTCENLPCFDPVKMSYLTYAKGDSSVEGFASFKTNVSNPAKVVALPLADFAVSQPSQVDVFRAVHGSAVECGVRPVSKSDSSSANAAILNGYKKAAQEGRLCDIPPHVLQPRYAYYAKLQEMALKRRVPRCVKKRREIEVKIPVRVEVEIEVPVKLVEKKKDCGDLHEGWVILGTDQPFILNENNRIKTAPGDHEPQTTSAVNIDD